MQALVVLPSGARLAEGPSLLTFRRVSFGFDINPNAIPRTVGLH